MNAGLDVAFVREVYQRMSDEDLIRTVSQDAAGLTQGALEVVKEEIKRRRLSGNIVKGVEAQQKIYTLSEIDAYCKIIQELPCPKTGSTAEKLNATLTAEVVSFILFTNYEKRIVVGSPAILDKANNIALARTAILGWWALPSGVIKTIQAIRINIISKKTNKSGAPNEFLRSFVISKIGQIEIHKDNQQQLLKIISER